METGHAPWWPCFWTDQICLDYFCRLPSSNFCYRDKPNPLVAMFLMDQISFTIFVEGHLRNITVKFG